MSHVFVVRLLEEGLLYGLRIRSVARYEVDAGFNKSRKKSPLRMVKS